MDTSSSSERPRIVIAGGTGFLGRSLSAHLNVQGYDVVILSRSAHADREGVAHLQWNAKTAGDWATCLSGAAAVVNLVGRSVDCRKTPENRKLILESRVHSCEALGAAMRQVDDPPPVWVQSATAHIVGDPMPEDTLCDDDTPPGTGLAPDVATAWEEACNRAKLPTQRIVILRISFVLGEGGGALVRLVKVTKLGLGGTVGSGRQYISWIHGRDLNRLIHVAIEDESFEGVYMTTAPNPVTNREFMRAMRKAFRRPWVPPAPTLGVKLASRFVLDTDPELALLGRRCVPKRLTNETAFRFEFEDVQAALNDIAD